jgi:predicted RNA polymerase sigma factor
VIESSPDLRVEHLLRDLAPQVLGAVVRRFRDFAASEDAVQEALLAAIAAVHDEAPRAEDTDWPEILALYDMLKRLSENPMVVLNHAVATAMVRGPDAGLELLASLDGDERLRGHHRLDAVRAHLLERAGRPEAAMAHYRAAAEKTTSVPERNYLLMRAARLNAAP